MIVITKLMSIVFVLVCTKLVPSKFVHNASVCIHVLVSTKLVSHVFLFVCAKVYFLYKAVVSCLCICLSKASVFFLVLVFTKLMSSVFVLVLQS